MIRAYINQFRAWLWRTLHPRAIECDLARHIMRGAAVGRRRVRR